MGNPSFPACPQRRLPVIKVEKDWNRRGRFHVTHQITCGPIIDHASSTLAWTPKASRNFVLFFLFLLLSISLHTAGVLYTLVLALIDINWYNALQFYIRGVIASSHCWIAQTDSETPFIILVIAWAKARWIQQVRFVRTSTVTSCAFLFVSERLLDHGCRDVENSGYLTYVFGRCRL